MKDLKKWLEEASEIAPEIVDWIGIYFKASYLNGEESTDLVLGPFIGEPTDHTRISIDRGMCGLALREERIVNVADVRVESDHIACSLSTRSELVIPLEGPNGEFIAELDIDSNTLNAFTPELEKRFIEFSKSFKYSK
ncbi:MAG: GAF domain-containing protein [Bacteriovoracaceae bacterium]|jgi:GAF domain-containing protein